MNADSSNNHVFLEINDLSSVSTTFIGGAFDDLEYEMEETKKLKDEISKNISMVQEKLNMGQPESKIKKKDEADFSFEDNPSGGETGAQQFGWALTGLGDLDAVTGGHVADNDTADHRVAHRHVSLEDSGLLDDQGLGQVDRAVHAALYCEILVAVQMTAD